MSSLNTYANFNFEVLARDIHSKARLGRISTPHGSIETPNFIFCATKAALKGITTAQARELGVEIILGNTYHLMLQPGHSLVAAHGGLHNFLDWQGPMLTDSGGFQIFSLGYGSVANEIKGRRQMGGPKRLPVKITEQGAFFRSYIDGKPVLLTPERSMEEQRGLGADLVVVLDECTPYHVDKAYTARSMELSHRWAIRSYEAFRKHDDGRQALYGIVQGGVYEDLRRISASFVAEQPFFGQAVGGSLGGSKAQMHEVVAMAAQYLHPQRPTHLLGIGGISDLWNGVAMGMDTFDCTHPTRIARHGGALVHPEIGEGKAYLNLKNTRFKTDLSPLEPGCSCYCCSRFTRAYLHHLIKAKELLAGQLITLHNMGFMMRMAKLIKKALAEGTFSAQHKAWADV